MSDIPGYQLDDTLEVDTTERKKALADPVRELVVDLVLERAMSVTELAEAIGKSKGTVAHHVEVLCGAGLLKVVRTRKVRAMEERFYGRTARTFVFAHDDPDELPFGAEARRTWDHTRPGDDLVSGFTLRRARIPAERAAEFWRRVEALALEFAAAERGGDREYAFYGAVFPTNRRVAAGPPTITGASDAA